MAEKDISQKTLEAYNDVFADIVNVLLFNGKEVIKPNALTDAVPTSQYKIDGKLHEQERDVAKYWKNGNIRIAIYGLENQLKCDKDMPLRVVGYDGAVYRNQLNELKYLRGGKKRYPVITLVLYFGKGHWNSSKSLLECLNVPEELRQYVSDYKINVFEIPYLTEEQVNMFKSDFKIVADYFVQKRLHKSCKPSTEQIKHVDEILKMMHILTNDSCYEDALNNLDEEEKAGGVSMYSMFGEAKKTGRMEMLFELVKDGLLSVSEAAKRANMSEQTFTRKMKKALLV